MNKPKWKILESTEIMASKYFRFRKDKCEMPDQRIMPAYYVIEFTDWVHVLPVTQDKKVVLVEQYRHACEDWFIELPGGSMDPGSPESPLEAGRRELLEETGYQPRDMISLGAHAPNPALQNNSVHSFLALGCEKVAEPQLDPYEDLVVRLVEVPELLEMARSGQFTALSYDVVYALGLGSYQGFLGRYQKSNLIGITGK